MSRKTNAPRQLLIVLGDQLNPNSTALAKLDSTTDALWLAEVDSEISRLPSHKWRITGFLAAMRHYAKARRDEGWTVIYNRLDADSPSPSAPTSHAQLLAKDLRRLKPEHVLLVRPGDHRVCEEIEAVLADAPASWEMLEDDSFYSTPSDFAQWRGQRKTLLMETFYRDMRKRFNVLLNDDGTPRGGAWNFDSDNRKSFSRHGPANLPPVPAYAPDASTQDVIALINDRYPDHPGDLSDFNLPVTPTQANRALDIFIEQRLAGFGDHQDAMWAGESQLWHSNLAFALNLKLITPQLCVDSAIAAFDAGMAPINAVEGFVRQILGWREFIRGVYFSEMPNYAALNVLDATADVPASFWSGETSMACVRDSMRSVLATGYAHHIQRLMVLGLVAQLADTNPYAFHEWHMAMYVDSVDWVSLPNTLGMSQYGDGGIVGSKPYCASGRYISRMSNYCRSCEYNPTKATGDDACPVTTLYWDFLDRHERQFAGNGRMNFQLANLARKRADERREIRAQASQVKAGLREGTL
ncbi:MAG: cryptochrome/photolyase family protein [Pseudomonadaceae bacterium]|nr:cryptochrome/photolyase family protein [Pseudomonadaceae bacterium]